MDHQQNYQSYEDGIEIELLDYVLIIWRRRIPIIIILVLAIALAITISFITPKTYESSALLEIGKIRGEYLETSEAAITYMQQPATLRNLAKKLNLSEKQWPLLQRTIGFRAIENFLRISAQADQPQRAKYIIEVTADLLMERHKKMLSEGLAIEEKLVRDTETDIKTTETQIADTEKEVARLKYPKSEAEGLIAQSYIATLNNERSNLRTFKQFLLEKKQELVYASFETRVGAPPTEPIAPINPSKRRNVIIAAIFGLFLGIVYAFIAEYIEKIKIKNKPLN